MEPVTSDTPTATILVVEDDPIIGRMLRETLEAEGFNAIIAHSGEDGVASALREVPQLLLLDIMLPGIDGFAVVERLRTNVKTAHIPVMMLSARHDTADKVRAFDIDVDDYLTKPFNPKSCSPASAPSSATCATTSSRRSPASPPACASSVPSSRC